MNESAKTLPRPGWWARHANDFVNICAVVLVSAIAFLMLALVAGNSVPSLAPSTYWAILVGLILLSAFGLVTSARRVIVEQEDRKQRNSYVVSSWTLKTLKASGLPDDAQLCLRVMLANAKKLDPPQTELSTRNLDDRSPSSWIGELRTALGDQRVNEFEDILIKYTIREAV